MSVPRLIVAGVEPGPALELVSGALLAGLGEQRAVRPVLLGLDLPLWRLLYDVGARAPRALDPLLHGGDLAAELYDHWVESVDFALLVAARPLLDSWGGVRNSRPVDLARRFDAPVIIAFDARDRGPTAAAAINGARALAGAVEFGGIVIVGGDDSVVGSELMETLRRDVALPLLGHIPPQLTEQFARQHAAPSGAIRVVGAKAAPSTAVQLCREAATYLRLDEIAAVAARRGFLPSPPRRLFAPEPALGDLRLAVAWGPPLQPLVLENIDLLQAMGLELVPLNIARDHALPEGCHGLLLSGAVDEEGLSSFTGNAELLAALRKAIGDGLPTLALGGGALLMLRRLADSRGRSHDLLGLVCCEAELIEWYDRPLYVSVSATRDNPYDDGESTRFELFDLEFLVFEQEAFAYQVRVPDGSLQTEGFAFQRCLATTLFPSLAATPALAGRFVAAMRAARD